MSENQATKTVAETSYAKGENFEKLFAEFMKAELGWEKYVIRAQQKGKRNSRGSQVDVIAERQDEMGIRLRKLAIFYYIFSIVAGSTIGFFHDVEIGVIVGVVMFIASIIAKLFSDQFHKQNAWVECKNRKTKSTYEDVKKSIDEYKDYKATGDKEYKYVAHYFVSASGFVENALKLANDNGLICYTYENKKFEKIIYWK